MDINIVIVAVVLVAFVFSVAWGLLKIHKDGFDLGRHSAYQAVMGLAPTLLTVEPNKIVPVKTEGPPVYSPREPLTTTDDAGPFSPVEPHAESSL